MKKFLSTILVFLAGFAGGYGTGFFNSASVLDKLDFGGLQINLSGIDLKQLSWAVGLSWWKIQVNNDVFKDWLNQNKDVVLDAAKQQVKDYLREHLQDLLK